MLLALNNNMKGFDLVLINSRENRTKTTENRNTTGDNNTVGDELKITSTFTTTTWPIPTTTYPSTATSYKTTTTQSLSNMMLYTTRPHSPIPRKRRHNYTDRNIEHYSDIDYSCYNVYLSCNILVQDKQEKPD